MRDTGGHFPEETDVKEHGFLFSAPMVREMLAGRKVATRRVATQQRSYCGSYPWAQLSWDETVRVETGCLGGEVCLKVPGKAWGGFKFRETTHRVYPRVVTGDRIWVREHHWRWGKWFLDPGFKTRTGQTKKFFIPTPKRVRYHEDPPDQVVRGGEEGWVSRPGIFMERSVCRLVLDVTSMRGERIQDISTDDIRAEGVGRPDWTGAALREEWERGWDALNGHKPGHAFADNPWVWVYGFEASKAQEDGTC